MKTTNKMNRVLFGACLLMLAACDTTIFGDQNPSFPSPFNEGEVQVLEPVSLTDVEMATNSQRHPGILYAAESTTGTTRLVAFDEDGSAQGEFSLGDVTREGWQDLAIRDEHILLLQAISGTGYVHRFAEPQNPSPFEGSQSRVDTLAFQIPGGDVSACFALGAAKSSASNDLWLFCGSRFFRLNAEFGNDSPQVAEAFGKLELLFDIGEIRDFSISPAAQYALLVGSDMALSVQAEDENQPNWANRFNEKAKTIEWDETFAEPNTGMFAFNSVLLYLAAPAQPQGLMFTIFTP